MNLSLPNPPSHFVSTESMFRELSPSSPLHFYIVRRHNESWELLATCCLSVHYPNKGRELVCKYNLYILVSKTLSCPTFHTRSFHHRTIVISHTSPTTTTIHLLWHTSLRRRLLLLLLLLL